MTTGDVAMIAYAADATVLRLTAAELHRRAAAEQRAAADADRRDAQRALHAADLLDRARRAELLDPAPVDRPWCVCEPCQAWLFAARWQRTVGS